jgi:DNA-binding LacI/PurR family transcriptional regulator
MSKKTRPTLRDIAGHLGIHSATVSRALRGDARITKAVRQRVTKASRNARLHTEGDL